MSTEILSECVEIETQSETESRLQADVNPANVNAAAPAVERMQRYSELTGLAFTCVDAASGEVVAKTDPDSLTVLTATMREQLSKVSEVRVFELSSGLLCSALPLPDVDCAPMVAIGYVLSSPDSRPSEVVLAAGEENWSQAQLDHWLSLQIYCSAEFFKTLLDSAVRQVELESREQDLQREIGQSNEEAESAYEEISLLHCLTQNLQISRSPVDLAQLCLSRLHSRIKSAGNVIWIEQKSDCSHFLQRGNVPFDEIGLARLLARFEDCDWSRPLVKNGIKGTLLGADFPGLNNLVIAPISKEPYRAGWILSVNLSQGRVFGTVEGSLLKSIATILGTHIRNIDLYQQNNDLLLSFVHSLVSTLDAKDPYMRGHSERVALIARRIGKVFNLPEEDLQDIYLSGLLHDIGKIGVDDRILQKPGQLTSQEFKKVQDHPMIGYSILQGLKNLRKVLPGVRSHHENYNGGGYPDGLEGEEIPLMARILAVADSYDAMGSDRPYRKGMPIEKVEKIFRRGAGHQWDKKVIDAYFSVNDEIHHICNDYSPSDGNLLESQSAEELLACGAEQK